MSEFNTDVRAKVYRMAAKKIDEKMRALRMSPTENSKRRWIWELLQNAKDKAATDFPKEKVSVSIDFDQEKNSLKFSHNFGYFTAKNIEGLIYQDSSDDKDRNDLEEGEIPKTTGRFGTGFMTTHLLSETVEVSGIYKVSEIIYKKICFTIDRSETEIPKIIQSIKDSFDLAEQSLRNSFKYPRVDSEKFHTIFHYALDEKGKITAEIGLNDLEIALPYTMIFVERIKLVIVNRNNYKITYEKKEISKLTNDIQIVEFDQSTNDCQVEKLYFAYLSKGSTSIAIPINKQESQIYIKSFDASIPKLFLDFPLIGTENFNFPVVVNNPFLQPTEPRDGVFLTDNKELHVNNNEKIIEDSIELYLILLQHATNDNWQNLYVLARTDLPKEKDWISINWYKTKIQQVLRSELLKSEIVDSENSEKGKIPLESALFPLSSSKEKREKLWEFGNAVWSDKQPKREHIELWHQIIDKNWGKDLHYDLKKLVNEIANCSDIVQLRNRTKQSEDEALLWLNQVIDFVVSEEQKLLTDFAIIPNQYGKFIKKEKEQLWIDDNIPEELKNVLKELQEDWRNKLKHRKITAGDLVITKGINDVVSRINQIIKENRNPYIKDAVIELMSCLPRNSTRLEERRKFWEFTKDFYQKTVVEKDLENSIDSIWEEADQWLIKDICINITQNQNLKNLTNYLKQNSLEWLGKFIPFINLRFSNYFNEYKVLPDQQGEFKNKKDLSVDDGIYKDLKDILEDLGNDYRSGLLAIEINLDIEGKIKTSKDVANEIIERVNERLKIEGGIGQREKKTKEIFDKLLLWFHANEDEAEKLFGELYKNRHRLKNDEEIIEYIQFKQQLSDNPNGYNEEEILELVKTPKQELLWKWLTEEETFQKWKELQSQEYQENKFENLRHISDHSIEKWVQCQEMINRAKEKVLAHLNTQKEYDCTNWREEDTTVIAGVSKNGREIKIVIRPSDNEEVIFYDPSESNALENPDTELWIDDGTNQEIVTLGKILKKTNINRIPWKN